MPRQQAILKSIECTIILDFSCHTCPYMMCTERQCTKFWISSVTPVLRRFALSGCTLTANTGQFATALCQQKDFQHSEGLSTLRRTFNIASLISLAKTKHKEDSTVMLITQRPTQTLSSSRADPKVQHTLHDLHAP